jgi:aldehyde:ferredoxin oxidoreductase
MDTLPLRVTEDAIEDGPAKGLKLPRHILNQMIEEYYKIRGWELKTGIPKPTKLKSLGLENLGFQLKREL